MPATRADLDRRQRGAWATPPWLVEHVLELTLDPVLAARPSPEGLVVLDPACGDGRFLVTAGRHIAHRYGISLDEASRCLVGVEIDGSVAERARERAGAAATIVHADALSSALPTGVDVVVGNPPYLNQLARATSRRGRSVHGGGPYADAAVEFLSIALDLARPGGRVGLVLPQSVLASRDAAPVRAAALAAGCLDALWWSGRDRVFDAEVHTVVAVVEIGACHRQVRRWLGRARVPLPSSPAHDLDRRPTWSHLLADVAGIPPTPELAAKGTVGDRASATAGFRDQFYGLVPFVNDSPGRAPLVTSGLLDPGTSAWGQRPARFAGRQLQRPSVDLDQLAHRDPRLARWVDARRVPKVLVATQTEVLEAAVDAEGTWVPSVPVVSVEPAAATDVWALGAVLCSPVTSAWAAATYLGAGLNASAIKLSAAQVLTLPWPAGPLDDAAAALRHGNVDAAATSSTAAFGIAGAAAVELLAWWRARVSAARRRSARASGRSPHREP